MRKGSPTPSVAIRRESALVESFERFLLDRGHEVSAYRYSPRESAHELQSDLFDETTGVLYEAKGAVSRESIRMAIGQLFDYARYHRRRPRLALLLPRRPSDDLLELLDAVSIAVAWRGPDGFEQIGLEPEFA